jgi:hypothetical protein
MIHKIVTVVSSLLVFGTAGLWWRSYGTWTFRIDDKDSLTLSGWGTRFEFRSANPWCEMIVGGDQGSAHVCLRWSWQQRFQEVIRYDTFKRHQYAGFCYWSDVPNEPKTVGVAVPFWFLLALSAIQPTYIVTRGPLRRWRRRRQGRCLACGYNLTGNVSGICSECGTLIAPGGPATPSA